MPKKNNRNRRNTGWARTKEYPHKKHPATYRRKSTGSDDIEYITFTHSPEVDFGEKVKAYARQSVVKGRKVNIVFWFNTPKRKPICVVTEAGAVLGLR